MAVKLETMELKQLHQLKKRAHLQIQKLNSLEYQKENEINILKSRWKELLDQINGIIQERTKIPNRRS